jgi:hypothetical protein
VEYFCAEDWTTQISLNEHAKLDFSRTRFCRSNMVRKAMTHAHQADFARRANQKARARTTREAVIPAKTRTTSLSHSSKFRAAHAVPRAPEIVAAAPAEPVSRLHGCGKS